MDPNIRKVVLLLSGGHDSVCLLWHLMNNGILKEQPFIDSTIVIPVFINYRQATVLEEEKAVKSTLKSFENWTKGNNRIMPLVSIDTQVGRCTLKNHDVVYGNKNPAYVPYRNLVLMSLALSHTEEMEPDYLLMAVHHMDRMNGFPDCSYDMSGAMSHICELYENSCSVYFPFMSQVRWPDKRAIRAGVPEVLLANCFSGYGNSLAGRLVPAANYLVQSGQAPIQQESPSEG